MLFKKPAVFIFKKKLTSINSLSTKYVKNLKLQNFNYDNKIKFVLNKAEIVPNLFNQLLKQKSRHFKNVILNKWLIKKHFKVKSFSRGKILHNYSVQPSRSKDFSNILSFQWDTTNLHKIYPAILNYKSLVLPFITNSTLRTPSHIHIFSSSSYSVQIWPFLISSLLTLSSINTLPLNAVPQLTKYFYNNQFSSQLSKNHMFKHQLDSFVSHNLTFTSTYNKKNIDDQVLSTTPRVKFRPLILFFKTLSKYLPHINLVRLFRRTRNNKPLSYNIDKSMFFKHPLIRLNLDYKYYKLNTLTNKTSKKNSQNTFSHFLRILSTDNLLETRLDSFLFNTTHTPFLTKLAKLNDSNAFIKPTSYRSTEIQFLANTTRLDLVLSDFLNIQSLISSNLLYKYIFWLVTPRANLSTSLHNSLNSLNNHLYSSRINVFRLTNIWPSSFFHFSLKRKILKIFSFNKFLPNVTMWYYNLLIRFMESCTGKKIFLKFNPFIDNFLSFADIARCNMWSIRINSFQRLLGPKIFLNESLRIMHIALRFKDPTFFANWIKGMLNRMSFWKYRLLFRYIKFAMRYLFWLYFSELQFKGLKIKLKGKISVAGNARTRTLVYRIGETGYSKIENRVICDSSVINTFTGVLGFKIWFFF